MSEQTMQGLRRPNEKDAQIGSRIQGPIAADKREYRFLYPRAPLPLCGCIPDNMNHRQSPAYRKTCLDDCRDVVMYTCTAPLSPASLTSVGPAINRQTHYLVQLSILFARIRLSGDVDGVFQPRIRNPFQKRAVVSTVIVVFRILSCADRTFFHARFGRFFHGFFP